MKRIRILDVRRIVLIVVAAAIMAFNLNSFIYQANLIPGGFTGTTILIQEICRKYLNLTVPFSIVNLLLNVFPVILSYRFIGKKFTIYSGLMIVLTSIFTDIFPPISITYDVLLICIFGGVITGFAICLCLWNNATSGGTDFISIFVSERYGVDAWKYILIGNAVLLTIAGLLFGWEKTMYSIIYQYVNTTTVQFLFRKYQKQTLWIITDYPKEVYEQIRNATHHDATLFVGTGLYQNKERNMLYSVVSSEEISQVISLIKKVDEKAFINIVKTKEIQGNFYRKLNE